jgi:gas vesicle protein
MDSPTQEQPGYGFAMGLLTGTCVGAGLALWFAPRSAAELRARMTETATRVGQRASERYEQATLRVGKAFDEVTGKGQDARDDVAQAVANLENEGNPPTAVRTFPAAVGRDRSRNATEWHREERD